MTPRLNRKTLPATKTDLRLHVGCGAHLLAGWIIRAYVADNQEFFRIQASLHPAWCVTKLEHLMYALQQDGTHKYGYDFETLSRLLRQAGFSEVRCSDYNASSIDELRVDYRGIRDDAGGYLSLFLEAVK